MKFTTLSSAAIVAALTIGALAPTVALADATDLDSTGNVKVEEGGTDPDEDLGTIDPEEEGETLPEPGPGPGEETNPDRAPLMIEKVTNLEFGTIKTSANEVTAFAAPMNFGTGEDAFTRGAYVQWRDIRAGGTFGYTVTAQMTQQFTGKDTNKLAGSTIDFSNGFMSAQSDNTNKAPGLTAPAFQLTENGAATTVVTANAAAEEGKGRYIMAFGDSRNETDANSVKLTVPAATASNMAVDEYVAKVTWKIVAAPSTPAPDETNN